MRQRKNMDGTSTIFLNQEETVNLEKKEDSWYEKMKIRGMLK